MPLVASLEAAAGGGAVAGADMVGVREFAVSFVLARMVAQISTENVEGTFVEFRRWILYGLLNVKKMQ